MPTVLDFQRLRETLLPEWTKPENASVFDPAYRAPVRAIIKALGLDDPQQAMALGTPLETGQMGGGALEAIGKRFPRFAQALKVYHGSPHDFEKFDASKIGTGEGAQAYGHGLYFAENPSVAESYRVGGHVENPYKAKSDLELSLVQQYLGKYGGNKTDAIREMQSLVDAFPNPKLEEQKYIGALKNAISGLSSEKFVPARMYEVAIHADPEHFLDWDKPLSQQSEHVQKALSKYAGPNRARDGMELAGGGTLRITEDPDFGPRYFMEIGGKRFKLQARDIQNLIGQGSEGKSVYQRIMDEEGGQVAASEKLRKLGITGLRYFDQASRTGGEGTRNYVVFPGNEHLIDILKKYGIAATTGVGIAGGLASQEGK